MKHHDGHARKQRILRTIGAALEATASASDETALAQTVCDLLIEEAGYCLAWFGRAEDDEQRSVTPIASTGHDDGYVGSANITWAVSQRGLGPTGRAIRQQAPVVFSSLVEDPDYAPWAEAATGRGFASSAALPVTVDSRIYGAINVYAARPDAFDEEEMDMLGRVAKALSRGLDGLRTRHALELTVQRLEIANQHLQGLYDASPDMIFLHDGQGRVLEVNRRAEVTFGFTAEELRTSSPEASSGLQHSADEAMAKIEATLAGASPDFEWTARRADGSEFPVEVRLRLLDGPKASIEAPHIIAVVRDLSERKRIEGELLQIQKLDLGVLAGGIAHDFNNLLTSIMANLEVASLDRDGDHRTELIREALQATEQARNLTSQLLTFARGGAPVRRSTDLGNLVESECRFAARGTALALDLEIEDDLPATALDPDQIRQVVHNLVLNAAQACPSGSTLRVTVRARPANEGPLVPTTLRVDFIDRGPGIAPEDLPRVFDPFFSTRGDGHGLGLTTAKSIVRQHDGDLTVESVRGRGTTFSLTLPITTSAEAENEEDDRNETPRTPFRVLVMDDQEMVLDAATRLLERLGCDVTCCPHGDAALALARATVIPFELAILDVTVPGGRGGLDIADELRAISPSTCLVATSGYSEDGVLAEHRRHGFDDILAKPYRLKVLGELLERLRRSGCD